MARCAMQVSVLAAAELHEIQNEIWNKYTTRRLRKPQQLSMPFALYLSIVIVVILLSIE